MSDWRFHILLLDLFDVSLDLLNLGEEWLEVSWLFMGFLHSKNAALVVNQLKELVDRLCDLSNVERCSSIQDRLALAQHIRAVLVSKGS